MLNRWCWILLCTLTIICVYHKYGNLKIRNAVFFLIKHWHNWLNKSFQKIFYIYIMWMKILTFKILTIVHPKRGYMLRVKNLLDRLIQSWCAGDMIPHIHFVKKKSFDGGANGIYTKNYRIKCIEESYPKSTTRTISFTTVTIRMPKFFISTIHTFVF